MVVTLSAMTSASAIANNFFIVYSPCFKYFRRTHRFKIVKTLKQEYSCGYTDYTTLSPFVHPNFSISPKIPHSR